MNNSPVSIVADTSAIINLNATQCAEEILRVLPERITVLDIVRRELEEGRGKGRYDADKLNQLVSTGLIKVVSLSETGEALFERLVVGPAASTVDDGEAATIAYAAEQRLGVIIDDAKARKICKECFSEITLRCSVDIFQHIAVMKAFGKSRLQSAVLNALKIARMRVLPEHQRWVIDLIGQANANECMSLPRRRRQVTFDDG